MWRLRSMLNHGSLSILMLLLLVHFHHDGRLVVVSLNWMKTERARRKRADEGERCACQLSALEVTRYSYVGKFKRPTSSFLLLFLLLLSYFRLLSFLLHALPFSSPTSIYSSFTWNVIDRRSCFDFSSLICFLESDIERLKRRIESLVKSNDEKVQLKRFLSSDQIVHRCSCLF